MFAILPVNEATYLNSERHLAADLVVYRWTDCSGFILKYVMLDAEINGHCSVTTGATVRFILVFVPGEDNTYNMTYTQINHLKPFIISTQIGFQGNRLVTSGLNISLGGILKFAP